MIIVLSVEHTGTHTVNDLLHYLGKGFKQIHVHENVDIYKGGKACIPIRDPLLQFMSFRRRHPTIQFDHMLQRCVNNWQRLEGLLPDFDCEFLRLDTGSMEADPEKRMTSRVDALKKIAKHVGAERDVWGYGWPVKNAFLNGRPTNYLHFNSVSDGEQKIILEALKPARERWDFTHWYN